jgi:GT2 family glycosyltransferase
MRLSVIVASYNARATIGRCLDALFPQLGPGIEVLVADSSTDGTYELLEAQYPWARLLRSKHRLFPGAARNLAIAESRGDILAFIDADCIAAPGWIQRSIYAQQRWGPVVGGSVDNANPADRVGWIYYFCEFAAWMPGQEAAWVQDTPTCCLTIDRSVLKWTGPFRSNGYSSDTAFHWRLAQAGIRTRFDPQLQVAHINPGEYRGVLRKMRMHGEYFAHMRCEEKKLKLPAVLLLWLGSLALPGLLLWRRTRQILGSRRYTAEFFTTVPGLAAALIAWSFGEWRGYGRWLWRAIKG